MMPLRPTTKIWGPLVALAAAVTWHADAAVLEGPSPIGRVTKMLEGITAKIQMQGKQEQASYDKFAKWGEDTLSKTAADISTAKRSIEDLQNSITQLKGNLGSLGATVEQLKSDVSENLQGQKDAETARKNEYSNYAGERTEAEQCIGALEASIRVLSSGSNKFLQNGARPTSGSDEAQLMSVAADVRGVLQKKVASQYMSEQDLQAVRSFVSNPANGMSAMQTGANPFGDYAPKSTQIQGILQGLYDNFVASLEKANAKEGSDNKAFEDLMDTKKKELKTLSTDLDRQELDFAEKKRSLASHREELDDTKADLKADEALFQETEASCKQRAAEWSQRSKLRVLELDGIKEALEILTSKEAQKAFKGAASLVQLAQSQHRAVRAHSRTGVSMALRRRAYVQLQALAAKSESLSMARIAVQVKSGDAFDKVIMMIDQMVADLRKESQEDIEHRDRCQNSENKNSNEKEDLAHAAGTMKDQIGRVEETQKEMRKTHDASDQERQDIEQQMKDRLDLRNEEHAEFVRALEADTDAVKVIVLAQQALKKFYEKTAKKLLQTSSEIVSAQVLGAPPKVSWGKEGGNYGGQKGTHKGALGALDFIKEDLEKEIKTGNAEDDEDQAKYEQDVAAMEKSLNAKKDTIDALQKQLAELGVHLEDKKATLSQNTEDANEAEDMTKALKTDCLWVKDSFDKRHKARTAEISGLQEAKDHLAKAGQGDEDDDLDLDSA